MNKRLLLRNLLLLLIWIPICVWSTRYALTEKKSMRLDFLISASGVISMIQQEGFSESPAGVLPNDHVVAIEGIPFDYRKIKDWLRAQPVPASGRPNPAIKLTVDRNHNILSANAIIKKYTKNSFLILFYLPLFASVIFLFFAIGIPIQRFTMRRTREAVEVFSLLCFGISIFFLFFFPTYTLGTFFSFSALVPILSVMLVHLFLVYPKEKLGSWVRKGLLGTAYTAAAVMGVMRVQDWQGKKFPLLSTLDLSIAGICFFISLAALGNTLLTSKDFWARRRARVVSFVFVLGFIGVLGAFVAFVWEVPRISFERILGASLFFPTAFAVIFLKSDVFDLERMFKRGLHQMLLLGMASTFALLVGLGWSQWRLAPQNDWMLWVAIAIVVVAVARPVGNSFESWAHRMIQTRVKYPMVGEIFENSSSMENFLAQIALHFEQYLNLKNITFAFFLDPTAPWSPTNEQKWKFQNGILKRIFEDGRSPAFSAALTRGDSVVGKISFDGGDAIAFDPQTSRDWSETVRSISRCLELLCLQEFVSVQQGFLAVGRMQSLLAHEMKNPLAIIKVCAGLLSSHMQGNEEGDELIKTIQEEVRRVAKAVQSVFEHSGRAQKKESVNLLQSLEQIREMALNRFPAGSVDISYFEEGKKIERAEISDFEIWVEREAFQQAVSNLVVNAFEASSRWVGLEVHLHKFGFHLQVKDKGEGIVDPSNLFKPFVTTKSNGTGLGLTQVKSFMDRNHGQIRFRTARGQGTSFTLEFSRQNFPNQTS